MSSIFLDDRLNLDAFGDPVRPVLVELIGVRLTTGCREFGPTHVLLAFRRRFQADFDRLLAPLMRSKQSPDDLAAGLSDFYRTENAAAGAALTRQCFTPEGLDLLASLAVQFPASRISADRHADFSSLLQAVCRSGDARDKQLWSYFFEVDGASAAGADVSPAGRQRRTIFDEAGNLDPAALTDAGRELLARALRLASSTGFGQCQVTHLVLACFEDGGDLGERVLRVFGAGSRLRDAHDTLMEQIRQRYPGAALPAVRGSFGAAAQIVLDRVGADGRAAGPGGLLLAVLENADLDPFARNALEGPPLRLNIPAAAAYLRRSLAELDESRLPAGGQMPAVVAGYENLTAALGDPAAPQLLVRPECEQVERGLFSRDICCVIVHGEPGVGRSAIVQCVAQRAAAGAIPFLGKRVFFRVDAAGLDKEVRGGVLRRIVNEAGDDDRIVLVIENFQCLVESAATQVGQLLDGRQGLRLIGITTTADYGRALAGNPQWTARLWTVAVPAADRGTTVQILAAAAPAIERKHGVSIRRDDLPRIVQLADNCIAALQRPKRAVELLQWACDEARFVAERSEGAAAVVDAAAAAKAIARRTSMDEQQILGLRGSQHYREELSKNVIGQPEAVELAARHVVMARSGARSDDRPAGVLLFAGQTGTGKTLLAKELARVFSPKGTLHTLSMGDFKERNDAKRFIGAPPGYVGYDEGGQLVRRLAQDPHCVVLFDEAEKAHPEVWDTCLQLFAEGWLEDASGQVAHANQTLFVMTTNLRQDVIDHGVQCGLPYETIAEQMQQALREARRPDTGQPFFRPELFGRIDGVVVFRPLGPDVLTQIAVLEIEAQVKVQRENRSVILKSRDGDWQRLAGYLSDRCREDPKHGRAVVGQFERWVTAPLVDVPIPSGGLTVQIAVEGQQGGQRIVLYDHQGAHLRPGGGP